MLNKRVLMGAFCAAFAVYSSFVYTSGTAKTTHSPLTQDVKNGMASFQKNNCIACHQFYGLGGYMGPDLTNIISNPDKGADYAKAFIESGTDKMPDFGLPESEIDDLVSFLKYVDASGVYPAKKPKINWNGTVAYAGDRNSK